MHKKWERYALNPRFLKYFDGHDEGINIFMIDVIFLNGSKLCLSCLDEAIMLLYITLSHFSREGIKKRTDNEVLATIYIAFLFSVTLKMTKS